MGRTHVPRLPGLTHSNLATQVIRANFPIPPIVIISPTSPTLTHTRTHTTRSLVSQNQQVRLPSHPLHKPASPRSSSAMQHPREPPRWPSHARFAPGYPISGPPPRPRFAHSYSTSVRTSMSAPPPFRYVSRASMPVSRAPERYTRTSSPPPVPGPRPIRRKASFPKKQVHFSAVGLVSGV